MTIAPQCAACASMLSSPLHGPVCAACWAQIRLFTPPLCAVCGDALLSWRPIGGEVARCRACRQRPPIITASRTAGQYDGRLRDIVHALKYQGRRTLAKPLARLMAEAGIDVLTGAACVVPVPLHPWRRLTRGFNQADDLARHLGPPVVRALWRIRATPTQTGLDAAARRENVRGAFRLSGWLSRRACRARIRNRIVVLVDDVQTTGATLEMCAEVLVRAGAQEVRALTAARAAPPGAADRRTPVLRHE